MTNEHPWHTFLFKIASPGKTYCEWEVAKKLLHRNPKVQNVCVRATPLDAPRITNRVHDVKNQTINTAFPPTSWRQVAWRNQCADRETAALRVAMATGAEWITRVAWLPECSGRRVSTTQKIMAQIRLLLFLLLGAGCWSIRFVMTWKSFHTDYKLFEF